MVDKKLTKDTLLDLYCLYRSTTNDLTIKDLAEKVGMSRNRLGELFKRINEEDLSVNYGVDESKYLPILEEWIDGNKSINQLAQKHSIAKSTLHRKFKELTSEK